MKKVTGREEQEAIRVRRGRWLPDVITMEILSRIPVKSIVRLSCVSKLWSSIPQDHHFIHMHLAQSFKQPTVLRLAVKVAGFRNNEIHTYSLEDGNPVLETILDDSRFYQTDKMEPSAYGLITCHTSEQSVVICNPATRDFVMVHKPRACCSTDVLNLGFHPPTRKYKLVRVSHGIGWSNELRKCDVLTLGSTSGETWRTIGEINFRIICADACVVDGVMYRVVRGAGHTRSGAPCRGPAVLSIDLGSEDIGIVKLPPSVCVEHGFCRNDVSLTELNGKLCCGYPGDDVDGGSPSIVFQMWLLLDGGWSNMCGIALPQLLLPSVSTRFGYHPLHLIWAGGDGIVLILHQDRLYSYDVQTGEVKVSDCNFNVGWQPLCVYVQSLVSVRCVGI